MATYTLHIPKDLTPERAAEYAAMFAELIGPEHIRSLTITNESQPHREMAGQLSLL